MPLSVLCPLEKEKRKHKERGEVRLLRIYWGKRERQKLLFMCRNILFLKAQSALIAESVFFKRTNKFCLIHFLFSLGVCLQI